MKTLLWFLLIGNAGLFAVNMARNSAGFAALSLAATIACAYTLHAKRDEL